MQFGGVDAYILLFFEGFAVSFSHLDNFRVQNVARRPLVFLLEMHG
jgi:hypothetical protein